MIDKAHILAEIRRTATANAGNPLGRQRFQSETGIKESDWLGRHWVRWGDAVSEAGFAPNKVSQAFDEDLLLEKLASFALELGHFPVAAELRMKASQDKGFPSHTIWHNRFGTLLETKSRLFKYIGNKTEFAGLLAFCEPQKLEEAFFSEVQASSSKSQLGYVYLLKFRSDYKIGTSGDPDRRYGEVATQMPEAMTKVHTIKTDDPFGVEKYWHQRFDDKRLKGEWFRLTLDDVRAFKRWKTIF
jgi:Meiotically up-regulated gene 113